MLSEKFIRLQLKLFKPFVSNCPLELAREGQDKLGQLLTSAYKKGVSYQDYDFSNFTASMITPKDELTSGVILYLHGGGYTCGDIKYAKGFGTTLAAKFGIKVFAPSYRLAPENPFPAALDDALEAYKKLITLGFDPDHIIVCGESAGGGLAFSLCLKLKELGYHLPAGIIGISPWTDLTLSLNSYEKNSAVDPSMTIERLKFYADCYIHADPNGITDVQKDTKLKTNPYVSPLFGDLSGMPPVLLFVGGDEIMLDDTCNMHNLLVKAGVDSQLIVRENMWHSYVLYCLKENESDFDAMSNFIAKTVSKPKKLHWMRLDNAAKIYPAIKTRRWNNYFRLSATLTEPVDKDTLKSALDVTIRRFPSIAVRLRRGVFWYYLEEIQKPPEISDESCYPLARTPFDDIRKCAFRVIIFKNRISVEFFHAITDGNGGLVFLKTLVSQYLTQKYNIQIPFTDGVLDCIESPKPEEIEDSFLKNSGKINASRKERNAYKIKGTLSSNGFCTNTTFVMDSSAISEQAKKRGVTVTAFLTAALIASVISLQNDLEKNPKHHKDVRVLIPVNLRSMFNSVTLRNFVLYIITGVDVRLGEYSLDELCEIVFHQMKLELTEKEMRKRISVNVNAERMPLLKIAPLFIKNFGMKMVFNMVGERKSCFSFSNLGIIKIPDEMSRYVTRMDFILGVQSKSPYNIGVLSYDNKIYLNFIRNIKEPFVEKKFYEVMRSLGIKVKAESNQQDE